jgi:hypothetical protein
MDTWNTLPESYQQRVYNNTLATAKHQNQVAEKPTPAVVISTEAASVDNAILLDYFTSEVALEEPEIRSTDPNIQMDKNCTNDELHFRMPVGSGDYEDQPDESDEHDANLTASQGRRPATEFQRLDLGTSAVDGYESQDGDDADADADEKDEALHADYGSTQNVVD